MPTSKTANLKNTSPKTKAKVTKTDLIKQVAEAMGISNAQSEVFLNTFIEVMTKNLQDDREITITGFGTFRKSNRKARNGINPRSGEKIKIAASTSVRFTVGKTLKESVA